MLHSVFVIIFVLQTLSHAIIRTLFKTKVRKSYKPSAGGIPRMMIDPVGI